jgi:hypothetical protein
LAPVCRNKVRFFDANPAEFSRGDRINREDSTGGGGPSNQASAASWNAGARGQTGSQIAIRGRANIRARSCGRADRRSRGYPPGRA